MSAFLPTSATALSSAVRHPRACGSSAGASSRPTRERPHPRQRHRVYDSRTSSRGGDGSRRETAHMTVVLFADGLVLYVLPALLFLDLWHGLVRMQRGSLVVRVSDRRIELIPRSRGRRRRRVHRSAATPLRSRGRLAATDGPRRAVSRLRHGQRPGRVVLPQLFPETRVRRLSTGSRCRATHSGGSRTRPER